MAELAPVAASVLPVTNPSTGLVTQIQQGFTGVAVVAGQSVYIDLTATPATYKLAVATSSLASVVKGVAMNNAATSQPINVAVGGDLFIGATGTVNTKYGVGSTPGSLDNSITAGWYPTMIGYFVTTQLMRLTPSAHNGVTA